MTQRLNPYLSFQDNAREAMTFYQEVFGGQLDISTFADMGDAPEAKNNVMHAMLTTDDGFALMASDTPPGMQWAPLQGMSVSLSGDETDVLTGYWNKLSEGGTVTVPLEKQMWGDTFGMCTDKFGVGWMVNIAGDAAQ